MEFKVIVNDKEYGPVDSATLELWVEEGRILFDTFLKDVDNGDIYEARSIDFLADAFKRQSEKFKSSVVYKIKKRQKFVSKTIISKKNDSKSEVFFDEYPVHYFSRVKAALIDIFLLTLLNFIILIITVFLVKNFEIDVNSVFIFSFAMLVSSVICYYTFSIGCFRKTLGMKVFGIKAIRNSRKIKKIFLLRAFVYSILMLSFWLLNIIIVFVSGTDRVIQDYFTDITIVG